MSMTIFDHISKLYSKYDPKFWDSLDNESKKTFNIYMLNRWLSMSPANVEIVNELQKYVVVMSNEDVYRFYSSILDNKNKPFLKYIKSNTQKYSKELLYLISSHYQESIANSTERLELILSKPNGKEKLNNFLTNRGYDNKDIKKLLKGIL